MRRGVGGARQFGMAPRHSLCLECKKKPVCSVEEGVDLGVEQLHGVEHFILAWTFDFGREAAEFGVDS